MFVVINHFLNRDIQDDYKGKQGNKERISARRIDYSGNVCLMAQRKEKLERKLKYLKEETSKVLK